jgi:hypothetical protein
MKDEELKESKLLLEVEIKNLQKFVDPAKKIIEELELKEKLEDEDKKLIPLSEEEKKKLEDSKSEVLLLEKEIKEREDKIKDIDEELKHREEVKLQIDNALKDVDFEEEEVHKRWDREKEEEVEYKVPLINQFLHLFEWCDHIDIKDEEGNIVEKKHIPWKKDAVIKDLKLKLDLDKANDLVRRIKHYKHNKKKGELESKLKDLVQNNVYFLEAFGEEIVEIRGEKHSVHHSDRIAKWDKNDLIDFEAKVLKLELAKKLIDEKEKKEKPIKERKLEYSKIDGLLLEALVEKLEEGRPEKMEEYLKLRKEIKDKHPLED